MLRIVLAVLTVGATLSQATAQIDYCAEELCPAGTEHIACDNDGAWGAACPTSPAPVAVDFDLDLRRYIIALHNVRRNNIATGALPNYLTAVRMATTRWSPQMATLAALNAKQCVMANDECHSTGKFLNSGQNLALITYTGAESDRTDRELLFEAISTWWNERRNASMAAINSYPGPTLNGKQIVHFTTMAQQYNWAVGCAAVRFVEDDKNNWLLVCNYATKNVVGTPVYVSGTTASGCTTGTNINYDGLCKVAEEYVL